jgi:hypothetical protein
LEGGIGMFWTTMIALSADGLIQHQQNIDPDGL